MEESLEDMLYAARTTRFIELVDTYGGPTSFAGELERRLRNFPELTDGLTSFMNTTYISNATAGRKRIGEAVALQIEMLFGKDRGWMSGDAFDNFLIKLHRLRKTAG